jgi:hypothetical protein
MLASRQNLVVEEFVVELVWVLLLLVLALNYERGQSHTFILLFH